MEAAKQTEGNQRGIQAVAGRQVGRKAGRQVDEMSENERLENTPLYTAKVYFFAQYIFSRIKYTVRYMGREEPL